MADELIYAIDISNYQGANTRTPEAMAALLDSIEATGGTRPKHVIVRAWNGLERQELRNIALDQLRSAVACGCTVSIYVWAYANYDPGQTLLEAMAIAAEAEVKIEVYWADLEGSGPPPGHDWLLGFIAACQAQGVTYYGVYTGAWWWSPNMRDDGTFEGVWLWDANYNGSPNLGERSYGGMNLVAHQYSDKAPDGSGLDMDVFHPSACGWAAC